MDTTRRRYVSMLVIGDVVVFTLFTALGRLSHKMAVVDSGLFITAAPIIAAWLVVGTALGAFSEKAMSGPLPMLKWTSLSWLVACPLGIGLRALLLDRAFSVPFMAVTLGLAWIVLLLWRIPFVLSTASARSGAGYSARGRHR